MRSRVGVEGLGSRVGVWSVGLNQRRLVREL